MEGGTAVIESWRTCWRTGFVPSFTRGQLLALKEALASDDPELIQGATSQPPPLMCVRDWPVEAACAVGFCGWAAVGEFATVGEVEEFFAKACREADERLGGPAECRWWLNFWDDTPRPEAFRELLAEVELALASGTRGNPEAA
jgi:hypothetical protein